jgi:hypothetical protein
MSKVTEYLEAARAAREAPTAEERISRGRTAYSRWARLDAEEKMLAQVATAAKVETDPTPEMVRDYRTIVVSDGPRNPRRF